VDVSEKNFFSRVELYLLYLFMISEPFSALIGVPNIVRIINLKSTLENVLLILIMQIISRVIMSPAELKMQPTIHLQR
jgi:hypothetical protein